MLRVAEGAGWPQVESTQRRLSNCCWQDTIGTSGGGQTRICAWHVVLCSCSARARAKPE